MPGDWNIGVREGLRLNKSPSRPVDYRALR